MIGNILKLGGYVLLAREAADFVISSQQHREREQYRKQAACSVSGSLIGMAVGVGIGLLFAPRPGKETREMISESACSQLERLQSGIMEGKDQVVDIIHKKKEKLCSEAEEAIEKAAG
ncbi:YtxH domain-containing protein [Desulfopila inferna]|uniref:YtxH domain-containing protein n=1 Tax=Desulfopila inferna TaxID=468528 RepID=UPI0019660A38|nr:YtxH domain-containing protein [Desulfopila inferna]MBM9604924.1 YtxH domain-containing protein [Desulfopila inferna]